MASTDSHAAPGNRAAFSGQRIDFLEGLRGGLSSWVMLGHIGCFAAIWPSVESLALKPAGYFDLTPGHSVRCFMILSGFVISFLLARGSETYGPFIFRRFFRLWPVFILGLAMGILLNPAHQFILANSSWSGDPWIADQLAVARADQEHIVANILWHLPMLHGTVPDTALPWVDGAFLGPGWSMSTEWQFYLLAPFLFWMGRRLAGFVALTALTLFCMYFPDLFPAAHAVYPMRSLVFSQLPWFYTGIISYYYFSGYAGFNPKHLGAYKAITFVVAGLILIHPNFWLPMGIWIVFFTLAAGPERWRKAGLPRFVLSVCNSRWAQYLGAISYPIYVFHWPLTILVNRVILAVWPHISHERCYLIGLAVVPPLTIALAHAAHYGVEAPCIEWARRKARAWRKSENPASETQSV